MKVAHDRTNISKRKGFENSSQSAYMYMPIACIVYTIQYTYNIWFTSKKRLYNEQYTRDSYRYK